MNQENKILRNANGDMFVSSTISLENEFLNAFAQTEEDLSGEVSARNIESETPQLESPDNNENKTEQILSEPDIESVDVIDWGNFTVTVDKHYSAKLQEEQELDAKDANDKSSFIQYTDPETGKNYAVQGPMYGINREKGIGESVVGGYKSSIDAGKELKFMQDKWESGFPVDRKYMIIELSELSPSLEAYERRKREEFPDKIEEQEETAIMIDEETEKETEKETTMNDEEIKEDEIPETPELEKTEVSKTKPQPSIPKPIGKISASILNTRLKRESRLSILKNI